MGNGAFNFGGYPGVWGHGYGGGFAQPGFGYVGNPTYNQTMGMAPPSAGATAPNNALPWPSMHYGYNPTDPGYTPPAGPAVPRGDGFPAVDPGRIPYTPPTTGGDILRGQTNTTAPANPLGALSSPTSSSGGGLRVNQKSAALPDAQSSPNAFPSLYPQPTGDALAQAALAARAFSSDQMGLYKALVAAGQPVNSMTGFQGTLSPSLQSGIQAAGGLGGYFAGSPFAAFFK